jgi:hypothetical protein
MLIVPISKCNKAVRAVYAAAAGEKLEIREMTGSTLSRTRAIRDWAERQDTESTSRLSNSSSLSM